MKKSSPWLDVKPLLLGGGALVRVRLRPANPIGGCAHGYLVVGAPGEQLVGRRHGCLHPLPLALGAYHGGAVEPIIECLADALELAVVIGSRIASDVDDILDGWASANTDRAGSASHRLPALLVEQPVVDVAFVASRLGITDRAARNLVEVACERGILAKMGNAKRGAFYRAPDLIAVLEEASSLQGIRRIAAR